MRFSLVSVSGKIPFRCRNQALRAAALRLLQRRRWVAVAVGNQSPQREQHTLDHKEDHKEDVAQKDHVSVKRSQDNVKIG